ncbi:MAG: GNAT family N-acetyltransferase [Candidatus Competibacterales bacterium]
MGNTIQRGFQNKQRHSAARLYDTAFGTKMSLAIPDAGHRIEILSRGIDPSYSFVALSDGQVIGVAGFNTARGSFTDGITFGLLKEVLGYLGAIRAVAVLSLFERKCMAGQLSIDGIAISPEARNGRIDAELLHHIVEYARFEGYRSIRLDIIDFNIGIRRLYERVGFQSTRTPYFAYLGWLLGFNPATQMQYQLNIENYLDPIAQYHKTLQHLGRLLDRAITHALNFTARDNVYCPYANGTEFAAELQQLHQRVVEGDLTALEGLAGIFYLTGPWDDCIIGKPPGGLADGIVEAIGALRHAIDISNEWKRFNPEQT